MLLFAVPQTWSYGTALECEKEPFGKPVVVAAAESNKKLVRWCSTDPRSHKRTKRLRWGGKLVSVPIFIERLLDPTREHDALKIEFIDSACRIIPNPSGKQEDEDKIDWRVGSCHDSFSKKVIYNWKNMRATETGKLSRFEKLYTFAAFIQGEKWIIIAR